MQFTFAQDVDTVFRFLTNPEIYIERCEALGEKNVRCDTTTTGAQTTQDVSRTVVRDLPALLKKVANDESTLTSKVVWNDSGEGQIKSGHYDAKTAQGKIAITIHADFSLKPQGDGCVYTINVDVDAKAPLGMGKVVKGFAQKEVESSVPQEHEWNVKKLATL